MGHVSRNPLRPSSTVGGVSAPTSTRENPGPHQPAAPLSRAELVSRLRSAMRGEVDESKRRRAEYSSDASNYRVVPQVVVYPKDSDDVIAIIELARETKTPITARGAGTSDRKSTRLNSSHVAISYAVFCLQ